MELDWNRRGVPARTGRMQHRRLRQLGVGGRPIAVRRISPAEWLGMCLGGAATAPRFGWQVRLPLMNRHQMIQTSAAATAFAAIPGGALYARGNRGDIKAGVERLAFDVCA